MFRKESDFEAFERVMVEAHLRQPIRILSYCVLSNHWHFVAWPDEDGQLTDFFRRLAHIHAIRWRVSHRTVGYGHLYQGRFKSFPVQSDDQLLGLLRYVERNPLSAGLVDRGATVAVGQPVVENARHGGDQSFVIALAGGTAGELDGSRQRSFDHEGIRPSAGEHRKRTTIRRREVGARVRAITIIDDALIKIIDGRPDGCREYRWPLLFSAWRDNDVPCLPSAPRHGVPHQCRIHGTSRPSRRQRSIAA